ncbi:uncharacterized protein [Anabrus simplex]|uniref:uncharacterized protein isoform X1 n=1 Tax=Anabrus simplex TaxID=316456 RepID=UPI0035A33494
MRYDTICSSKWTSSFTLCLHFCHLVLKFVSLLTNEGFKMTACEKVYKECSTRHHSLTFPSSCTGTQAVSTSKSSPWCATLKSPGLWGGSSCHWQPSTLLHSVTPTLMRITKKTMQRINSKTTKRFRLSSVTSDSLRFVSALKHRKSFSNRQVEIEDQKFARRCDKAAQRILEELEALISKNGEASSVNSAGFSEVVPPQPDQIPVAWEVSTGTSGKRPRPPRHRSRPSNNKNNSEKAPPSRSNSAPPKCNLVVKFSSQPQEIILPTGSWRKLPRELSIPPYRPFCAMDLCPFTMKFSEVRPIHEIEENTQGIPSESK